jgi:hypothetical protein
VNEPDELLFSDPSKLFEDGLAAKEEERQRLGRIFAPEPEPAEDEATLDELADVVAERILEKLAAAPAPEPPGQDAAAVGGFDGGARPIPLVSVSHDQTLLALLRTRGADVGGSL